MMVGEETVNREVLPPLERSLATAENLLAILRAETEALKGFEKERLLELLIEKEALARELAERMMALQASQPSFETGREPSRDSEPTGASIEGSEQDRKKRASLRGLLDEIVKCNHRNHVFVQGSLGLWQELLTLCLPATYLCSQAGQAARQPIPTKGLALNREI